MSDKGKSCVALILAEDNEGVFFNIISDENESDFREELIKRVAELRAGRCDILRIFIKVCQGYEEAFEEVKNLARDFCCRKGIYLRELFED